MKIWKWLVLGLVLTMAVNAVDFPGPFASAGNLVIVVGDNGPAEDVVAATDISVALDAPLSATKLASEIDDISKYNSILIGSPCVHAIINQLLGYPERCQVSGIKFVKHSNGNVALLIMGSKTEVRQLARSWIIGTSAEIDRNSYESCMAEAQRLKDKILEIENLGQSVPAEKYVEYDKVFTSCRNLLPPKPETYDSCISEYENKAREYETWRQNMPEGRRIREEGLRVCGERFGRPVPPVKVETEFDRCMNEGYQGIYALPEDQQGTAKQELLNRCEPLRPVPREESEEYKACIENLNVQKQELNKKYTERGVPIPDDVMRQYQLMSDRCLHLAGWTTPETTTVPVPAVELVAPTREAPPCVGCKRDSMCLQFGIRLVDENRRPVYCDFDGFFKPQKQLGEACQNNYECASNTCSVKCISVTERIEAVERELKEQRGLIEKILDFFRRLF